MKKDADELAVGAQSNPTVGQFANAAANTSTATLQTLLFAVDR